MINSFEKQEIKKILLAQKSIDDGVIEEELDAAVDAIVDWIEERELQNSKGWQGKWADHQFGMQGAMAEKCDRCGHDRFDHEFGFVECKPYLLWLSGKKPERYTKVIALIDYHRSYRHADGRTITVPVFE